MKINNLIVLTICLLIGGAIGFNLKGSKYELEPLPKQENSEGLRGSIGIDKNVNDETIDKYLGRSDTVYRDMRMLVDTANWEIKGGSKELTGYIEGFEVIPYAYLTEFPEEYVKQKESEGIVGLYSGKALFRIEDGKYIANYKESMGIIEAIFPKDKYIFVMCGSGGIADFTKKFLVSLGWDKDKIYNIGGFVNYKGKNKISTKIEDTNKYDFSKVAYHNIDFDILTPVE